MTNSRFPLTAAQQDIYFDQLHRPDSPVYNLGGCATFGVLDIDKFKASHRWLVSAHDAFGIRVVTDDTGVSQYISEQRTTTLMQVDFSAHHEPEVQATRWAEQVTSKAMAMENCELYQCYLIKLAEHQYWYFVLVHHLAIDGAGYANLVRHLNDHYNGTSAENSVGQWRQVCEQDQRYLSGKRYQTDKAYWCDVLADLPDNPLPAHYIGNFDTARLTPSNYLGQTMPGEWHRNLAAFADSLGAGVAQVMLAILSYYFAIACQQPRLTVGLPLHNRNNAAQKKMVGMFVGISPMRINVDEKATFAQLVESVQRHQKQNLRHQRMPIGHMINELSLPDARERVFDISFNYQMFTEIPTVEDHDVIIRSISHGHETTPLGLKVMDYGQNKPIYLQLDYNQAYFCPAEIKSIMSRLLYLVELLPKQPDRPLSQLSPVPPAEYRQLLAFSNSENVRPAVKNCIHHLFAATHQQVPHKIAVSTSAQKLTYRALNQKANQIANCLISKGVGADTLVGLCVERSVNMAAAILGILKSGGAYVPMDPQAPQARLHHMLNDSAAKLVITEASLQHKVDLPGIEGLLLDAEQTFDPFDISDPQTVAVKPDNLAYVIYTSGSTGQPKGVMVAHQTACTLANEMADWPICNTQKSWGWNANVVFDASIHGLLRLCMGQQVVVLPNDAKLMPQQLVQIVADENIGVIDCTPSMVAMWFNAQVADRLPNLVIGGEAIGDKLWQQLVDWQNAGESRKAVNIYGPTECCVNITCHPVAGKQPTIGRPLGHVKSYLTDAALRLAPKGVVAELLIGGPCVTQGYLNQPGLTAQRFIQNPFSDDPQDCLYRTGDLVRYLEDGNLAYVGRSDDQLKIRGYRIEAGEVQSQLDRCDNVRGSVVIADAGQQRLVAYVVTCGERKGKSDESQGDFITDLKTRLRTRLPHYMVPDVIILLASFVLTSNGKIDKKSLPPIDDGIKWGQYVAAKNHQQQTLVVIWAALLGLDCARIGIDDNFFQLGGHSLLAVELAIRVSNRFNCSVTINDVFRCRTIAQLAAYLEHAPQSTLKLEITTVERDPDKPPLASFAQQRLYFISLQDKESAKYNLPCAWLVSGAFLPDIAEQALANIITCHESLRTNFANQQMTTVQIINPCTDFKLTRVDLTGLSSQRTEQRLAHLMRADANTAFCLERDLMLRASFVQLTKGRGVLLINIHHIATDGWSNNLLIKAFNEHYQMLVQGINVPSPPLSIQYADFTHSQRRWIADGHFESQLVYWEKQLAGLPEVHSLPINAARQTEPIAAGGRFVQKVSEQTLSSLSQIAKDNNASLFMLLHGSFALLLSRYSNCEDIVVAIPTANRLQQQLSPLIGFFVNTLALRIDCSLDCDFEAFLNAVKTVHLDGQANQAMPFDLVVDRLKPNRSHTYSPLFQFMFAMNTNETTRLDLPGLDIEMLDNQPSEAKFELSATVEQSAQGLNVEFSYNSALFDGDFIEQLAGHYGYLLGAVARGPKCNIHELPLWPQSHTKQLIAQINRR